MTNNNFSFHFALYLLGKCKNVAEVDAVMMISAVSDLITNKEYISLCHIAREIRNALIQYETRS